MKRSITKSAKGWGTNTSRESHSVEDGTKSTYILTNDLNLMLFCFGVVVVNISV